MAGNRKIRLAAAAAVLLLMSACGGSSTPTPQPAPPPPPTEYPSSRYWLMRPGSWDEYEISPIEGELERNSTTGFLTGNITITRQDGPNDGSRVTNLPYHLPMDPSRKGIARVHTRRGMPATTVPPDLAGVLLQDMDEWCIGEGANVGAKGLSPTEPVLSLFPYEGETRRVVSTVTNWDGKTWPFVSLYRTVRATPTEVEVVLIENPEEIGKETIFHYTFDGGLKRVIYGRAASPFKGSVVVRVASGP